MFLLSWMVVAVDKGSSKYPSVYPDLSEPKGIGKALFTYVDKGILSETSRSLEKGSIAHWEP